MFFNVIGAATGDSLEVRTLCVTAHGSQWFRRQTIGAYIRCETIIFGDQFPPVSVLFDTYLLFL